MLHFQAIAERSIAWT